MQTIDLILTPFSILNILILSTLLITTPLTHLDRARFLHFLIQTILLLLTSILHILRSQSITMINILHFVDWVLKGMMGMVGIGGFVVVHVYILVFRSLEIYQGNVQRNVIVQICVIWYYIVNFGWFVVLARIIWSICSSTANKLEKQKEVQANIINIYQLQLIQYEKNGENACTICLLQFQQPERLYKLSCQHIFHEDCLEVWVKKNVTCPNCRASMVRDCGKR